jgi:hypothetical protein
MSKRLTVKDWDDVADLCGQAADMVGYSVVGEVALNSRAAKDKAVEWMQRLAMKAHCNARRLEAKEKRRT